MGVNAAHRGEMLVEGGIKHVFRFNKSSPSLKGGKLGQDAARKTLNFASAKSLPNQNPKHKSNIISRQWQKHKLKRGYAKTAWEKAKQARSTGSVTGGLAAKPSKFIAKALRNNPKTAGVAVIACLVFFALASFYSLAANIGASSLGGVMSASYLAPDTEISQAILAYTEWETELREQIAELENNYPGFDEYIYHIGEIGHNPLELMAYLTVKYLNFSFVDIVNDLWELFNLQYHLSFVETVETRYNAPTDPYDWKTLATTLNVVPLSDIIQERMDEREKQHFDLLMESGGNRHYVGSPFAINWHPHITSYFGYRTNATTGVGKEYHTGIDIGLPLGTEILSAQVGTVTFAGYSGNYGNLVIIEIEVGLVTKYAHCNTLLVAAGQMVFPGQAIATVGSTGRSTGPHLHFEVLLGGELLNPLYYAAAQPLFP